MYLLYYHIVADDIEQSLGSRFSDGYSTESPALSSAQGIQGGNLVASTSSLNPGKSALRCRTPFWLYHRHPEIAVCSSHALGRAMCSVPCQGSYSTQRALEIRFCEGSRGVSLTGASQCPHAAGKGGRPGRSQSGGLRGPASAPGM